MECFGGRFFRCRERQGEMSHRSSLEATVLSTTRGAQRVLRPILGLLPVAGFECCLAGLPAFISEIYPLYQFRMYLPRTPSLSYPSSAHKLSMAPLVVVKNPTLGFQCLPLSALQHLSLDPVSYMFLAFTVSSNKVCVLPVTAHSVVIMPFPLPFLPSEKLPSSWPGFQSLYRV